MKQITINCKRRFITLLSVVLVSFSLYAGEEFLWEEGNNLYSQGKFQEALDKYHKIEEEGLASDMLYFNIANSYFKLNRYGKAILYYERALTLNPSDRDIRHNLSLTNSFIVDNIDTLPEFILKTWMRDVNYLLSANQWTYLSLFIFALSALFMLLFRYGPSQIIRKSSFFMSALSMIVAVIMILFAVNQRKAFVKDNAAVVMSAVSTIRSSPDNSGNTLFILHEGTKVILLERLGSWRRIELSDGRQGWVPESDIEVI